MREYRTSRNADVVSGKVDARAAGLPAGPDTDVRPETVG